MVVLIINIVNVALVLGFVYLINIHTYQTDFKPHRHKDKQMYTVVN